GAMKRLDRIDIAQTGDALLVEQRELDRLPAAPERPVKIFRREVGIERLRPERPKRALELLARHYLHPRETALIGEDQPPAVVEMKDGVRMRRQLPARHGVDEAPRHAQ